MNTCICTPEITNAKGECVFCKPRRIIVGYLLEADNGGISEFRGVDELNVKQYFERGLKHLQETGSEDAKLHTVYRDA